MMILFEMATTHDVADVSLESQTAWKDNFFVCGTAYSIVFLVWEMEKGRLVTD